MYLSIRLVSQIVCKELKMIISLLFSSLGNELKNLSNQKSKIKLYWNAGRTYKNLI